MGSTLEHGIYLPSEGEKNCYQGLAGNWNKVDGALGDIAELKQSIESKFTKEIVTELPTEDINPFCIYMILKTDPETDNVYDEWVYINNAWEYLGNTKVDMTQYYTKQEVNQLPAVASGVTATKVGNYDAHIANGDIHVTASDKTKWTNSANTHVLRLALSALTPSTSGNSFSNLDDSTALKVGDKVMDTAGVLFEVTAVDTANSTFTIGTALIDLAQDSDVVHKSGNETVDGIKTFNNVVPIDGAYLGNELSNTWRTNICLRSNRDTAGKSGAYITRFRQNRSQGALQTHDAQTIGFDVLENEVRTNNVFNIQCTNWLNDVPQRVNLVSSAQSYSYGNFLKKALINDLNPGSLSLPDLDNGIDISGFIADGNSHNEYTPTVDGWISVIIKSTGGSCGVFLYQGGMANGHDSSTSLFNEGEPCAMANLPVKAGTVVNIDSRYSKYNYVYSAKFYPCQGNV